MRETRRKVIKPVYKDDNDSEESGDFSDSGSEAKISEEPSSDDEEDMDVDETSGEEFVNTSKSKNQKSKQIKLPARPKFAKNFITKLNKQSINDDPENVTLPSFSVKDLTEADKLLPSVLNLSESDSSEDESLKGPSKNTTANSGYNYDSENDSSEDKVEFKDVWSNNIQDNSDEIARKTFMEFEQHKSKIEEAKVSIQNYSAKLENKFDSDVKDLLAQGEDVLPKQVPSKKQQKNRKNKEESEESDVEEWEEVKETKSIPQQGLQLVVDFPNAVSKKSKKLDIEMMMKRKINRVKKEYQIYMHKVHVLCWLGHGNYVSRVLNNQEVMAASIKLLPSKECYPGERIDVKYVEQITKWYKDKLTLKQDKNEDKFRPKAPPLKEILLSQINNKVATTKKYLVYIFVSILRALGLQCRVMFNFVTVPIKPPNSELCSLSTKSKDEKLTQNVKIDSCIKTVNAKTKNEFKTCKRKSKLSQLDGNDDSPYTSETDFENLMQVDGANDVKPGNKRSSRIKKNAIEKKNSSENEDVSPPKRTRMTTKNVSDVAPSKSDTKTEIQNNKNTIKTPITTAYKEKDKTELKSASPRKTRRSIKNNISNLSNLKLEESTNVKSNTKTIKNVVGAVNISENIESSKYFEKEKVNIKNSRLSRNKTHIKATISADTEDINEADKQAKTKKTQMKNDSEKFDKKSKYFSSNIEKTTATKRLSKREEIKEDSLRVSHKDLKSKIKPKNDIRSDLIGIIKNRVREEKTKSKKAKLKGKATEESGEDSDYLPEDVAKHPNSDSDDDFKPKNISPKPSTSSKKIDRRVLSSDDEITKNKTNVWCEVFVEELEQWVAVDVVKMQVHCVSEIYGRTTHPAAYIVGWDNNNYVKDLTRRYVPHWNTVTRKQRAESEWWNKAIKPWLGPKTARDREEDEYLDRMQLEAPLPKSILEYKNHPLYALKRHLLKFEAIYPPDAATLGFVRGEPVYSRDCVYVCRSRDIWLKEAKVVRLGEKPYKIVKARPKWDKLSNKVITDKPLEIFGPWQVQDYEPPVAENGIVPRNAYGNVELFKECMLPKGTAHVKLPGLNRVAKKLNIDCAPAMIGFDFNGGWSHPVYDGFVVCKEFEEIITEAWLKDQEEYEKREREKTDARVYGNWRRLIKGLLIRERLKNKYGFENPKEEDTKKKKGPRLVLKKK